MKYLKLIILCNLLSINTAVNAEMYKHVDENGVVTYSDTKESGAKEITPTEGNTIQLPKFTANKKTVPEEKAASYTSFKITSPENDSTVRDNNGNFSLSLSLKPDLLVEEGHYISGYVDGQIKISKSISTSIPFTSIDRGTHTLHAVIHDSNGKNIIKSNSITIHLHKFSR